MTVGSLQALERVHALVAWAATAALVVTAGLVQRAAPSSRAPRVAGVLAIALVVVTSALGLELHDPYRGQLRHRLFVEAPALGWLFERKLHAAFGAVFFAVAALALRSALERRPDGPGARDLARSEKLAWTASAVLALAASVASAMVAGRAHF